MFDYRKVRERAQSEADRKYPITVSFCGDDDLDQNSKYNIGFVEGYLSAVEIVMDSLTKTRGGNYETKG